MGSSQRTKPPRANRSFAEDDRAIEGLPIRLVIALIIGVVSLGIMLQILGGIGEFGTNTEVDVNFPGDNYIQDSGGSGFTVEVIDENNELVPNATVVATAGSARMDAVVRETNDDGKATFDFDGEGNVALPPDADTGTIEFEIQPPTDTNWEDAEPNNELTVVSDS